MHQEVLTKKAKELFPLFGQFREFYLAGGTALALELGHRVSVDFDFFSKKQIDSDFLPVLEKYFKGRQVFPIVNNADELTVSIDAVKTTFLFYPFPLLFHLVDFGGMKLASAKEVAAMKAYAIGRRGSLKDYVDIYFILFQKIDTINGIIDNAEKKYGEAFNARLFLEQLVYFKDVAGSELKFLRQKVTPSDLESFFQTEIKKLKL